MQQKCRKVFACHVNVKSYDVMPWLCGCSILSRLFCWTFCFQWKNVYLKTEFDDLGNLRKTQKSQAFLKSYTSQNTSNEFWETYNQ